VYRTRALYLCGLPTHPPVCSSFRGSQSGGHDVLSAEAQRTHTHRHTHTHTHTHSHKQTFLYQPVQKSSYCYSMVEGDQEARHFVLPSGMKCAVQIKFDLIL